MIVRSACMLYQHCNSCTSFCTHKALPYYASHKCFLLWCHTKHSDHVHVCAAAILLARIMRYVYVFSRCALLYYVKLQAAALTHSIRILPHRRNISLNRLTAGLRALYVSNVC